MKLFRKPDLKAPRNRPQVLRLVHKDFYNCFRRDNPAFSYLSDAQILEILTAYHGFIWDAVVNTRDGVELPENIGTIWLGSCPRKKHPNIDFKKSAELGFIVQHQNWESDQFLAKIFYSNFETRYKFKFHDLWGFEAVRQFKRKVGEVFPANYTRYIHVDDTKRKASRYLRRQLYLKNREASAN